MNNKFTVLSTGGGWIRNVYDSIRSRVYTIYIYDGIIMISKKSRERSR